MVPQLEYTEQRPLWSLRLTGVAIVATSGVAALAQLAGAGGLSILSWLAVTTWVTIALLALSFVRMVVDVDPSSLTVRLLAIRLLQVQLDTISSIDTVEWRQPTGLTRWVLEGVMPPGGVRISTADGRQRFVATDDPNHLADLLRSPL